MAARPASSDGSPAGGSAAARASPDKFKVSILADGTTNRSWAALFRPPPPSSTASPSVEAPQRHDGEQQAASPTTPASNAPVPVDGDSEADAGSTSIPVSAPVMASTSSANSVDDKHPRRRGAVTLAPYLEADFDSAAGTDDASALERIAFGSFQREDATQQWGPSKQAVVVVVGEDTGATGATEISPNPERSTTIAFGSFVTSARLRPDALAGTQSPDDVASSSSSSSSSSPPSSNDASLSVEQLPEVEPPGSDLETLNPAPAATSHATQETATRFATPPQYPFYPPLRPLPRHHHPLYPYTPSPGLMHNPPPAGMLLHHPHQYSQAQAYHHGPFPLHAGYYVPSFAPPYEPFDPTFETRAGFGPYGGYEYGGPHPADLAYDERYRHSQQPYRQATADKEQEQEEEAQQNA